MQALIHLRVTIAPEIEQIRTPVGDAGRPREPGEVAGAGRVELNVATISTAIGPSAAAMDPSRRLQPAGVYIGTGVANQGEHGVEQRHLDALAASRALTCDQCHDNPGGGEE